MDDDEVDLAEAAIEHEIDRRRERTHCECGRELASYERNSGLNCGECRMEAHFNSPDTRPRYTDETGREWPQARNE